MPPRFFEQEYLCQFLDPEDSIFDTAVLQGALAPIPGLFSPMPGRQLVEAPRYYIGLDLGQVNDYTAICVIERACVVDGPRNLVDYKYPTAVTYSVRYLERLPLGTSYTDIADHVRTLVRHPVFGRSKMVIMDATGVSRPVVDLMRRTPLGCNLVPVTLTGGGAASSDGTNWRVPRQELLSRLEIALVQGQLKISSELPHAETLVKELQSLRRRVGNTGEESIHPWRESQHDDFVFAAALANWRATLIAN